MPGHEEREKLMPTVLACVSVLLGTVAGFMLGAAYRYDSIDYWARITILGVVWGLVSFGIARRINRG